MGKKRSVGVTILAILMILDSGFNSLFFAILAPLGVLIPGVNILFVGITSSMHIILNVALITCAVGLLVLKEWARKTTICVYAIQGVLSAIGTFLILNMPGVKLPQGLSANFTKYSLISSSVFWGLVKFAIVFFFLTRPKVKEQFKKEEE